MVVFICSVTSPPRLARLDDLPAGSGTAALLGAWRLGDLDGKPEGLTFTAQVRAIVGLDTRKSRRNLVLLEPAIAQAEQCVNLTALLHERRCR